MKICTQLKLLILFMVLVPFFCALSLPVFHYLTSPQHYLLNGYKQIRDLDRLELSDRDWNELGQQLKKIPPDIQTLVYYNSMVLLSSVPEIPAGTNMPALDLFDFIRSTSNYFDYQLQSLGMHPTHSIDETVLNPYLVLIVTRAKIPGQAISRKHSFGVIFFPFIVAMIVFEIVCAIFIVNLSKIITSSITLLEQTTQKIANGELDTKIITPKKGRNSNEITSLAESLEKMRVSLKDDQSRRTKFIMGISHDLRTPVALIKGYTEAITDGVVNDMDTIKHSLSIIHSKADQLENMINDLINYVKLNNTDWRQSLECIAIKPVLDEFCNSALATAEVYKRDFEASVEISPETKVKMDKNLFCRALENIYSNAIRYTKDGDVIKITAVESPSCITISMSDSGIGISEKDLVRIWDIFYRGTNSRRECGMGIGLSVVKTIIDTHGWTIDVKSKLGEGTTFVITIIKKRCSASGK